MVSVIFRAVFCTPRKEKLAMPEKIPEIFLNTMFEYDGFGCCCAKDTENVAPDEPPKTTLKLYTDISKPLRFSYVAKTGLNLTGKAGGVIEKNILGKILALPNGDIDKHIEFFKTYGFLLPLSTQEYESVDADVLLEVVNRIKATIRLMNAIGKKDYKKLLIHATYLLFSPVQQINTTLENYETCRHRFSALLGSYNMFPDLGAEPEVFVDGTYSVQDTILSRKNPVDIEFYNAVRSSADTNIKGSKDPWFKNIMAMYTGCQNEDEDTRILIDFFYHFQTEVSAIKEVKFNSITPYSHIDANTFSDDIKSTLLNVARIVVAEEINHNIRSIHPRYDGGKLTATWQVDTLIQAIYFSIFYMKAGVEIYKECGNPNCKKDKFFLVDATRTNKRYCCEQCRNAAGAQRYRNRQL